MSVASSGGLVAAVASSEWLGSVVLPIEKLSILLRRSVNSLVEGIVGLFDSLSCSSCYLLLADTSIGSCSRIPTKIQSVALVASWLVRWRFSLLLLVAHVALVAPRGSVALPSLLCFVTLRITDTTLVL